MGREAVAVARWRGEVEEVKVLLESQEIILRGAIKARMARSGISDIILKEGELAVQCNGEALVLDLGAKEAVKWRDALLKPHPSLASKLGIGEDRRVFLIGKSDDSELVEALAGSTCTTAANATVLLAIIATEIDLLAAHAIAKQNPNLLLWCVYSKGKNATYGDTAIRSFMRQCGYMDSKSCAVSSQLTATRYGRTA
jgi:hypothetical protein